MLQARTAPRADRGRCATVAERIAAVAARGPAGTAVVDGDRAVTYADLWQRTAAIAGRLRALGVRDGEPVAVYLERSADCVAAAAAVLAAGGAYLMLDVRQPAAWTRMLLDDSAVRIVLARPELWADAGLPPDLTVVPVGVAVPPDTPRPARQDPPRADALAYVSYTSGSSGTPKGVLVEHGGLANLVDWYLDRYHIAPGDHLTQLARPSFDAFALEVWPCLSAGATLHIVESALLDSPDGLRDWLLRAGITVAFVPTPLAEQLLELPWPEDGALRDMMVGGDRLTGYPAAALPFRLHNLYGPTEGTVVATCCEVPRTGPRPDPPPIGRPISGVHVHVLDQHRRPVPDGEPGELHLGGVGVARGYLTAAAEQRDRFWSDPCRDEPGGRAYATGDLVRRSADGQLHFLGRVDDQIQVRGFRVEPGEIEAVLRTHPAVARAAVVARHGSQLAAYVVVSGSTADPVELRRFLAGRLPDYLVPSVVVMLDELPRTARGKVDRRALAERSPRGAATPAPRAAADDEDAADPAVTRMERLLTEAWSAILKTTGISPHDNFFEIGGDSLGVMRLVSKSRRMGITLRPEDVYANPVLRDLVNVLLAPNETVPSP